MANFMIKYIILFFLPSVVLPSVIRQWQIIDEMLTPVAGAEVITFDNKIYIFGGYTESEGPAINTIQVYDPAAAIGERWQIAGQMLFPRSNFVARLYQDTVYIVGGRSGRRRETVTAMETWTFDNTGKVYPQDPVLNRIGSTGEIWQHYFIILGGYNGNNPELNMGYITIYDLAGGRSLGQNRIFAGQPRYSQASILVNNYLFIFGGVRGVVSNRVYRIDLDTLDWEEDPPVVNEYSIRVFPDLPHPRSAMKAVQTAPDTVYLIGGHDAAEKALNVVSKFIVTPYGYQHSDAPPLQQARKDLVAAVIDTVIYVFGGVNEHDQVLQSVEALVANFENSVQQRNALSAYRLAQNYPNPFNLSTTIEFELPKNEHARLDIFASNGELIRTLVQSKLVAGTHHYLWDGNTSENRPAPSGIYFYTLTTESNRQTRKLLLVK